MIGTTTAALLGAGAIGGSLAGGLIGQGGANSAAAGSRAAGMQANAQDQHQIEVNNSNSSPWTNTGTQAIGEIGSLLGYGTLSNPGGEGATYNWQTNPSAQGAAGDQLTGYVNATGPAVSKTFQADPSYAWRVGQGTAALDRSATAKGTLLSGGQAKALTDYGQGAASQEYQNWWNRTNTQYQNAIAQLFQTAGLGASVEGANASTNSGLATAGGNALVGAAGTAGAATIAGSNALASGIGSGINNALGLAYLGGLGGGGGSSYSNRSGFSTGQGPLGPSGRY